MAECDLRVVYRIDHIAVPVNLLSFRYAGRVELPNNLKQHFRPIAMTVPDAQVITEVVLFSYGFSCAPTLAKKVAMLYNFARTSFSDAVSRRREL